MNQKFMWCVFVVLFLGMGAGCLHSPLEGATRGVLEIRNEQMFSKPEMNKAYGILTGVAIGEHTVLTAAHAFGYEPEPGHPLKIGGEDLGFEIVIDGWAGERVDERYSGFEVEAVRSDYLLLKTKESLSEHSSYVTLTEDRVLEFRNATLVTRRQDTGESVAISLRRLYKPTNTEFLITGISYSDGASHYLSGSPVVAEYKDGTRVLVGIATAKGSVTARWGLISRVKKNQLFITPAYAIPFADIAE